MSHIFRTITSLFFSLVLFVGISALAPPAHAAILPQEAKDIIQDSSSVQEAGSRLKDADSSEKVRNRETLDTAKEVTDRIQGQEQDRDRRDRLMNKTKSKLKDAAENVKEKLNLDEPIPESTKEFVEEVKEDVNEAIGKPKSGIGFYQRKPEVRN
jgi:lipopolysaccharide export LptBFGC system permease protein LptF